MRRGMRKMRNERIAVERGQRSTTEEQCKWMATRYVSSPRGCCTQKRLLGRVLLFNWCRSLRLARRTWREKNSKTKERYFFKQNHSLPIMPWSTNSHKSFTQVSSRNWTQRPDTHQTPCPWQLVQSWLHELFTDWWYSAERWSCCGNMKRSATGSNSNACTNCCEQELLDWSFWWPPPHRLHDSHVLALS